jgi:DNA polymerase III alpha subunit
MHLDHLGNPVFNEKDLFDTLYKGYQIKSSVFVENSLEIENLKKVSNLEFLESIDTTQEVFDKDNQTHWLMPSEYKTMDIEGFLVNICPEEHYQRLIEELQEYRDRNMLDLLRWLKYFVDICRSNNIVWGVGRGSSVASYVLYLIGVHRIDSIKYNLDWREFLR